MTSLMPTWSAMARAARSLSPVSRHGLQPEGGGAGDRVGAGGLDGVGDDEDGAECAVPAGEDRGLAASGLGCVVGCVEFGRDRHRPVGEQEPRPADDHRVAVDDALDAETLRGWRSPSTGAAGRRGRGGVGDGLGDRVLGGVLERADEARTSSRSVPSTVTTSTRVIRPVVTVPVLSSTTVSIRRVDSRTSGPLMRMPELGAASGADEQCGRGGETECAWAGDDQHGDGGGERAASRSRRCRARTRGLPIARAMTTGTNTAEIWSARRCTGALPFWASVTSRAIWASAVSAPTRWLERSSRPPALTVAPVTGLPVRLRPVPIRRSAATRRWPTMPSSTTPSVATFSPGRTTNTVADGELLRSGCALGAVARGRRRPWRPCRAAPVARHRSVAWPSIRSSGRRG